MRSRNIIGFENYIIYEDGRVFSKKRNKFLKPRLRGKPERMYKVVALYDGLGKPVNKSVHILVAEAFIPNPEGKLVVNHKDNDQFNNNVYNLEWVTHSENVLHSWNETNRKRLSKKVVQIDKDGKFIAEFDSLEEASKYIGVHYSNISKVLSGVQKTAGGYKWKEVL